MYDIKIEKINLSSCAREEVENFLSEFDLTLDNDVEYTLVARSNRKIVGTGSFSGNVIKCFAVSQELQGEGISAKLISNITNVLFDRGIYQTFIFTKPANKHLFEGFGYNEVYSTKDVILLETGPINIRAYIDKMFKKSGLGGEKKAAIVMNCNPFTLGHYYLIKKASCENETVVIFVVEEDRSLFPFAARYELIKQGVRDLKNVYAVPGGDYIISSNTFPSYFIKEEEKKDRAFEELDAGIFGKYIAPIFNIDKRYVGTEPYCPVTNRYNKALQKVLPEFDVEVKLVNRLELDEKPVSASYVRSCIKDDNWLELRKIVPESTYSFLRTPEGEKIVEKIKKSESRH